VGDSMEKRLLLSFGLSFLVLLIFYQFFSPPPPSAGDLTEPQPAIVAAESIGPAGESAAGEPGIAVPQAVGGQGGPVEAAAVETVTLESALYSIRISNAGAVIEGVGLREHRGAGGETLELLDPAVDGMLGWPLELVTGNPVIDERLRTGLWVVERDASGVRLELAGEGLEAFKEIRIDGRGYQIAVDAGVRQDARNVPFSVVWQGSFGDQSTDYMPAEVNLVYQEGGSFERLNVADFAESGPLPATGYAGLEDQYFLAMFISPSPQTPVVRGLSFDKAGEDGAIPVPRVEFPYSEGLGIFIGPKQRDQLGAIDPALASVIDYGFFQILVQPLLSVLLWIQGYVGNFGWSIILMTLLINTLLFPLRLKQQLSMLKMQKIQPQMRTLQDKYKKLKANDPRRQEVQSEMMGLYQKHGVNPLGGCLPLILQMPIFIAIFQLLRSAIELRQAPWMLWVQDLSVHDPYYVLPVLMGLSMLASQRMMPTTMDPAQARIMMFMPLLFMVFMVRAQSGLVLYWLTSQLVGVGQQLLINRYWAPRSKKAARPPQEQPEQSGDEDTEAPRLVEAAPQPDASRRKRRRKR